MLLVGSEYNVPGVLLYVIYPHFHFHWLYVQYEILYIIWRRI